MRLLISLFFTFSGLCVGQGIAGIVSGTTYWWTWFLAGVTAGVIGQFCITAHETDCIEGTLIAVRQSVEKKEQQ